MREQILRLRVCRDWRGERWFQYTHLQNMRRGARPRCRTFEFVGRPSNCLSRDVGTVEILKHLGAMLEAGQLVGNLEVRFFTRRKWNRPRAKKGAAKR